LPGSLLQDPSARRIAAGDLEAVFLPRYGMLGASLRHRRWDAELLGRVENLEASAASGSTAGIPLLHPWANRLAALSYRAAGKEVRLDPASPLLRFDARGLPIHGVPWARLSWTVTDSTATAVEARLDWAREDLLAIFPYPHRLDLRAEVTPEALEIETTLTARDQPVPVAFGFHPYLRIPDAPRAAWRLRLPDMRRLVLDASGIPTRAEEPFAAFDAPLADSHWDDGFELEDDGETFEISAGGFSISVELVEGYPFAQVYAPADKDYIALEPMTAPTSALTAGRGLSLAEPGGRYRALFRIRVEGS
jgi:galactose mutarotase-like enzyme